MNMKYAPWGVDPVIEWDEMNEEKVWAHGISAYEVDDCFDNRYFVRPHEKAGSIFSKFKDRYIVEGVTKGGRSLVIIVQYSGNNVIRPITAWDISK